MSNTVKISALILLFLLVAWKISAAKSVTTKLNNPFNIMASGFDYAGETTNGEKFERFKSIDFSVAAWLRLIRDNYINKGFDTIEKIMYRYAPPHENDTEKYINYIISVTGTNRRDKVNIKDARFMYNFARAITFFEGAYKLTLVDFRKGLLLYKIKY